MCFSVGSSLTIPDLEDFDPDIWPVHVNSIYCPHGDKAGGALNDDELDSWEPDLNWVKYMFNV